MTRLRLTAWVLAGLAVAGCGADPVPDQLAAPAEVLPTATPSAAASPPASVPVADGTTEPAAAAPRESAEIGGDPSPEDVGEVEQAARSYYTAINRAVRDGEVGALEALSIPECNCRGLPNNIRQSLMAGEIQGAEWHLQEVRVQNVLAESASVLVKVVVDDGRVVAPDGTEVATIDNLGEAAYVHAMLRTPAGGWITAQVVAA